MEAQKHNAASVAPPAPVWTALAFVVNYAQRVTAPTPIPTATPAGVTVAPGRKLDVLELRTRDSALEVLRSYFASVGTLMARHEDKLSSGTFHPPVSEN